MVTTTRVFVPTAALVDEDYGGRYVVSEGMKFRYGRYDKFRLGLSPEGVPHRKVHAGPGCPELFASLIPECTVIADYPIVDPAEIVEITEGTLIEVEGHGTFRVVVPPKWVSYYPTLEVEEA
jgi:hypothetical protein